MAGFFSYLLLGNEARCLFFFFFFCLVKILIRNENTDLTHTGYGIKAKASPAVQPSTVEIFILKQKKQNPTSEVKSSKLTLIHCKDPCPARTDVDYSSNGWSLLSSDIFGDILEDKH